MSYRDIVSTAVSGGSDIGCRSGQVAGRLPEAIEPCEIRRLNSVKSCFDMY